jgi:superfamily II RNA helicase
MSILAILWSKALDLHKLPLTKEVSQHLATLHEIFSMAIKPQTGSALPSRPLPFKSTIKDLTAKPQLPMGALEFQLEHCGPYLDRSFDSVPDPRVDFNPDAWQRKVLDAIDADKSLLVIAPTSAGKTFISFYAMKKILRESDEGVLVYVAPTKALVNQIAAEIQARFSKNHRHEGKSVWAIHTRDYRVNNPTGCQILVTVPHMLQIMLLAPSNAKSPTSWSRRVKRIIFDEVHSIGQAEDGIVWEQLLLLAPCPIIALSATIGNPEEFTSWLEGTQKAKGFDFTLVVHSSRYSDLRKFIYSPPKDFSFDGFAPSEQLPDQLPLPGLDAGPGDASRFAFVHPVGAIVNRYMLSGSSRFSRPDRRVVLTYQFETGTVVL